jgi:hypothetical protein
MRRDETIKLMNDILQEQCRLNQLDLIEAFGAAQCEAGKQAARASESSPPQPECAMEGCNLVARYCVIHGAAATAPSAPQTVGYHWDGKQVRECTVVAAPSAPITTCPQCKSDDKSIRLCPNWHWDAVHAKHEPSFMSCQKCINPFHDEAAPSAPTALTICPICDRGVDRICDVLAVQIGTEWYHKPCSRFAGEHARAVVLPAPTTQTRKEKR